MPDYYHSLSSPEAYIVDWNIGGYPVRVPKFMAERRGDRSQWEKPRFEHMEKHLHPGMVLFDVGAEQGDMSAIYAGFVGGGHNMVLIEPVPQSWVNIKAIWSANHLDMPRAVWCGFAGERSWTAEYHDFPIGYRDGWPECAYGEQLLDATKFRYSAEHQHCTDSTTLDDFVAANGIVPDAITIDVEGFEPTVIAGSINVIRVHRPLIWLSIHNPAGNNILQKYTGSDHLDEMHQTLIDLGYSFESIAEDHEIHTAWFPR